MRKDLVVSESGTMQYQPVGTKFTALETATNMIVISDNTATNMLIDRLGGAQQLNQRFLNWGLSHTQIHHFLPDLAGTNVTTPHDLANLMALISQGKLVSMKSRDRLLSIMRQTVTNTLLPQGLGAGATIAHKTGDIGAMVGDVGLIDMPNGKRYVAVAMVKRPFNDPRAQELIRQTSRVAYRYLLKPASTPTVVQPTSAAPEATIPSAVVTPTPASGTTATEP
ncbi:serine hydrolase [Neosynechococcus sphagnicola]|uniref:serine hydrolase n=1 Tax=Neosynechococcus sphagnicola TaxID=1501145 RepID=UPI00068CA963|nr:serine hydrolase [Neosynechococcus sphagnicola]